MRLLLVFAALVSAAPPGVPAESYQVSIETWRSQREARLKADDGWLTVAGLFWLKEGENSAGSGERNDIRLPRESAPERIGSFVFHGGRTTFIGARGAGVASKGAPVTSLEMRSDKQGSPDVLVLGHLSMHVIERGRRFGIRLRDRNSRLRREFRGLEWFPVQEAYRVTARFVPHASPWSIAVPNVLGDVERLPSPGYVMFRMGGKECRLEPVAEDGLLFFIFRDLTSAKETYPSGRFLYAPMPEGGRVVLDFNKAVNPPCAFTPYATCPLPPRQNHLSVRIPAGEKRYGH